MKLIFMLSETYFEPTHVRIRGLQEPFCTGCKYLIGGACKRHVDVIMLGKPLLPYP
ncbi:hypothetical protein LCGC14_1986220, partial [marine sediment metagenome]